MTEDRDPYAVLEIASSATPDEVAAAYRTLARRHHPDVSREPDAEQRMAEINAAWTLLREPAKRAAWDRAHGITPQIARRGSAAAAGSGAGTGGSPGRPAGGGPLSARPAPGTPWPPGTQPGQPARPQWRRGPDGEGAAGPPPGNPRGSVLPFGRHIGWSLGEVARVDPGYLAWLAQRREGERYREEIERLLAGSKGAADAPATQPSRKGRLFRR